MSKHKNEKLVKELEALDLAGLSFHEAKKQLLSKGYSEADIDHAIYSAPFDGKINQPKVHPHTKMYEQDPKKADIVAKELLKQENLKIKEKSRAERIAYFFGSRMAPGPHARSKYELHFFDEIGIPYFTSLLLIGIWLIVLIRYNLMSETLAYLGCIAILLITYLWKRLFGK